MRHAGFASTLTLFGFYLLFAGSNPDMEYGLT